MNVLEVEEIKKGQINRHFFFLIYPTFGLDPPSQDSADDTFEVQNLLHSLKLVEK